MAGGATTVAIDGDYFDRTTGAPSGIYMQDGVLDSAPATGRSSLGIAADGTLTTDRVSLAGLWQGSGQRRAMSLNTPAEVGEVHALHAGVRRGDAAGVRSRRGGDRHVSARPARPAARRHRDAVTSAGGDADPARRCRARRARHGRPTAQLKAEAPVGQQVEALLSLSPDWSGLASAIGGGPLLVKNGKPIFHAGESFASRQLNGRQARGAIGQLPDGRIVLVSVEGTKPAYSIGMSNYELAVELSRLGATTAFGLGAGPAAGLAFDGKLLTRPSTGVTPKVSDALVLSYTGVYAAPPSTPVLSPNGDGVGDTESFSYRVARPSQVVATLTGPGGAKITLANGDGVAGAARARVERDRARLARGRGQVDVHASREPTTASVTTSAQRTFSLDDTLSSLALKIGGHGLPTATFLLTRAATVLVQIQRPNGVPVATLRSGQRAAGPEQVTWRGRIGRRRALRRALPGGRAGDELRRHELARGAVLIARSHASLDSPDAPRERLRRASPPRSRTTASTPSSA